MSDSLKEPTNLPAAGAAFEPRGYYLALGFHPAVRLSRKSGLEFAARLSDYMDLRDVELGDDKWEFSQPMPGSARSLFSVSVFPAQIRVGAEFPTLPREWFEERQHVILQRFGEIFSPQLILHHAAMVRGTMPIDGDARLFLVKHVMRIDASRAGLLRRPIHIVGLRLAMPPFRAKTPVGAEEEEGFLDVKAESLGEDPTKLFLEADGRWLKPQPWSREHVEEAIQHLDKVRTSLERDVVGFLKGEDYGQSEGTRND